MSASNEIRFLASHEWGRIDEEGVLTVGISEHAQDLLGDIVFVELPDTGKTISKKDDIAIVESVKAASDVYSPLSGEIVSVNEALNDNPELINSSPYDDGWFFKIKPQNNNELEDLLDAEAYTQISES